MVMANGAAAGITSFGTSGNQGINLGPLSTGDASQFRGRTVLESQRYAELDRRESYFACAQHDTKRYDFDGRTLTLPTAGSMTGVGALATVPMLSQSPMPFWVPLRERRPSTPYRLPKVIVKTFTAFVFGENRFPQLVVKGDEDSQDFLQAIITSGSLPAKMIQARDIGGSVGTVGLSWCFDKNGRPRFNVHNGKHLFVHAWEDRGELIPSHVTEVMLISRDEWDGVKRKYLRNWYWSRRDWTPDADYVFMEQKYEPQKEPTWIVNEEESHEHGEGICHFEWIQNTPSSEEDGLPDYHGLYEKFDILDVVNSIVVRGGIANLDPTLVMKVDPMLLEAGIIKKGSDNALAVGEGGEASYLELTGQSLEAGIKLIDRLRGAILESAQCIIPDPDTVATNGTSSVAMKMIHAPTLAQCDVLREQYAKPMKRMLENMLKVCRAKLGLQSRPVQTPMKVIDPDGSEREEMIEGEQKVEVVVALPPKIVEVPMLDEMGQPVSDPVTGERQIQVQKLPRRPGEGGEVEWQWPPYFAPTSDDQSKIVTTLTSATGGKAILSQETAVQITAQLFGQNPDEEVERVEKMRKVDSEQEIKQAAAFAAANDFVGGAVGDENELPEGAEEKPSPFGDDDAPDAAVGDPGIPPKKPGGFPPKKPPFGGK